MSDFTSTALYKESSNPDTACHIAHYGLLQWQYAGVYMNIYE